MRIYLSGPITGLTEDEWRPPFREAARILRFRGHDVFSPEETPMAGKESWTWEDFLAYDLARLLRCDALCLVGQSLVPSRGVRVELAVAAAMGLPVITTAGWN
jgi:nucleoside 2-deoxyribosyltransferase